EVPDKGDFLDAGCGTGDYAIGLATVLGSKGTLLGVDPSEARLNLARSKASLRKLTNIAFQKGSLTAIGAGENQFDLVIGDATLLSSDQLAPSIAEIRRAARPGGRVALIAATSGSFDEIHSIYWEALYQEGLLEYSSAVERLATARPTTADLEALGIRAGLRHVRSSTRKQRFNYADASAFLSAPLIVNYFLRGWLALLPNETDQERVLKAIAEIIERSRGGIDFDMAIRATVLIGLK
ncbi:MAG: class I SAM-dependent methyltransferase, partial [Acidobacteriota bacterium]